jgi:hypothetical protein
LSCDLLHAQFTADSLLGKVNSEEASNLSRIQATPFDLCVLCDRHVDPLCSHRTCRDVKQAIASLSIGVVVSDLRFVSASAALHRQRTFVKIGRPANAMPKRARELIARLKISRSPNDDRSVSKFD